MNKQKDCGTCNGKGYKFFTDKEMQRILQKGYDIFNISNKCPDCDNKSYDCGGVFPRI
tara:strand:- start:301 stop:474 length:174 start_codon:yes stop_codon:yes gene_type:complete